jgi:hypothetical protein
MQGRARQATGVAIYKVTASTNSAILATPVSLDADGFTLNFSTVASGNARWQNYIALAGVSVAMGTVSSPASSGNTSVTGLSFQPNLVLFASALLTTANPSAGTTNSVAFSVGAYDGTTSVAIGAHGTHSGSTSQGSSRLSNAAALNALAYGSVSMALAGVSLNSDGFTVNWPTTPGASRLVPYLALGGISAKTGVFQQPASATTQNVTGLGMTPKGVILLSHGSPTLDTVQADFHAAMGASDGTTEGSVWAGVDDGVAASSVVASTFLSDTKVLATRAIGGGSTLADADLTAMASGQFSLDWTTADSTQRQVAYIAMGDAAPPPSSPAAFTYPRVAPGVRFNAGL